MSEDVEAEASVAENVEAQNDTEHEHFGHDVEPGNDGANDFDEVARTLSDAMSSQLASLRQIVVEAESKRERDSTEIARLRAELTDRKQELADRNEELSDRNAELADRNTELSERNTTIQSMQQKLRELADTLG